VGALNLWKGLKKGGALPLARSHRLATETEV
jgi:hypothetical protein